MENTLHGILRLKPTKGQNNRLRSAGRIPGVMYGLKNPNFLVEFAEAEVLDVLNHPSSTVNVDVNGETKKAIIKEVQRSPITRQILHIDLQMVDDVHKIHTRVPVKIVGEDKIKRNGGMAQVQTTEVEIEGTADKLPRFITADLSKVPVGGRLTVGDLEVSSEISIVGDPSTIIASVTYIKDMQTESVTPDDALSVHGEETNK